MLVVGILSVGEPQLKQLILQLLKLNCNLNIYVFENFDNVMAHKKIYDLFNKNKNNVRVKLDADMTISDSDRFIEVISASQNIENTCQVFKVYDYFTNRDIHGIHVYSPNFQIDVSNINFKSPFVDQFGLEGVKLNDYTFVNHGENYTYEQCQDFIVHRLRKAVKSNELRKGVKYFLNAFRARRSIVQFLALCLNQRVFSNGSYKSRKENLSSENILISLNFVRLLEDEF